MSEPNGPTKTAHGTELILSDTNLTTERLEVPGGWLYITRYFGSEEQFSLSVSTAFVPRVGTPAPGGLTYFR